MPTHMPIRKPFDYAIIRVVPRIERGEFINAGVVLFCRTLRFLDARIALNEQRLVALAPGVDAVAIYHHLATIPRVCAGGLDAGPIGLLSPSERFHWLTAPRSTIIQPSPLHSGLCCDAHATLERLFKQVVDVASDAKI